MNSLAPAVSILSGLLLLLFCGWMWRMPVRSDAALRAFPRSVWPGRILIAVSLIWFAHNLNQVDLGRFDILKNALWVLVPLGYYLITTFVADLLTVRGLCTLCLLAGQPLLVVVRWQGFPANIAVALLVYALMVLCMFLVVYPHFWIRTLNAITAVPRKRRLGIASGAGLGGVMLLCGLLGL